MKRDFLTLKDWTTDELKEMIDTAIRLKKENKNNVRHHLLEGKKLAMIFEKPSTRTRVSFEVGMYELGGYPLYLSSNDIQLGRGETVKDTARTLSRFVDAIMIRTKGHDIIEELAKFSTVPVINGLTDDFHPCQVMADVQTIFEHTGTYDVKVAFIGDGNNMAQSWLFGAAKFGMDISVASPEGYECKPEIVAGAREVAKETGSTIELVRKPIDAVKGADIIITDTWASMGQEAEKEERKKIFSGYQVDKALMDATGKKSYFMHCLPAYIGQEVTEEVYESEASIIWDEAENRLHAQKAVMLKVMS
ncbi:MAG: ornithine carbamoyltransferase [Denitrovibrio sp.]|nr:MAG: ornithine carbamoyltransferase [Denitrovibrio sp.]